MKDIADRIQERMQVTGIKQADIQRATGAGKATISGWVKGSTKPSSEYLTPLASVLKCIYRNLDGTIKLHSDNSNKDLYPDQDVSEDLFNTFEVIGRLKFAFVEF